MLTEQEFKISYLLRRIPFCKGSNRWGWIPPYFFNQCFSLI